MKEIISPFNKKGFEVDTELDTIGVIVDREVYCGHCRTLMINVRPGKFVCPNCHASFEGA